MDELDKGLAVSVQGALREQALGRFRDQVAAWQLVMPPAEPLVLDFGLGDFWRTGLIECWVANEAEAGYCGKYLFVFAGQSCPRHCHRTKHETFFVVKGRVRMGLAGTDRELAAGDVLPMPPGTPHGFTGLHPALLLEVSKPCVLDDNEFEDRRIRIGRRQCAR